MMRGLGYDTLSHLREELLADLTGAVAPSTRMQVSIEEAGTEPARLLDHVIGVQQDHLAALRAPAMAEAYGHALDVLAQARTVHVFGLGPSGAMADYLALQLGRVGLPARAMTHSGIGLADQMLAMRVGDALVMISYAPLYREVRVLMDRAETLGLPVVLISDSLGALLADRVTVTLPVPRGRSNHLALHSATLVMIEALVLGHSARSRDQTLDALDDFAGLRATIDNGWAKRGTRRRRAAEVPAVIPAEIPRPAETPPSP
jgi:DNA-binding MurR/RpiR family transcriptional regulator